MNTLKYIRSLKTLLWISFGISIVIFLFSDQKSISSYITILGVSLMYSFGFGVCNYLLNDFLDQKFSWKTETTKRTIWAIAGTLILNFILTYLLNFIFYVLIQKVSIDEFFSEKYNFINWFYVNFALLVSTFLHARGFMIAMKQSAQTEIIEQKLIAKSANAQFESLKNQLDPHFLFNSLNVLSALIEENPSQAQDFTSSMSKIYRYVLEQKDKELVSVEEELDFAKTYSELLKTRFEEAVQFQFDVSENTKHQFVVPLSLQLLLENVIKHNFATAQKPLVVKIYSDQENLMIENNLQQRDPENDRKGIGLANIVQRYSLLTKRNVYIEKSNEFFRVKIPILQEKKIAMNTQNFTSDETLAYQKAVKRVKELKSFYGNLTSYCLVMPFLIVLNIITSPKYYWFWWPMIGWGIGVLSHALQTFGIGKTWEERKIKEIMEKQNH